MTRNRDDLLDSWMDLNRRLATHEAQLHIAVDLLMETVDVLDPHTHARLDAEIRTFLMNAVVGGR